MPMLEISVPQQMEGGREHFSCNHHLEKAVRKDQHGEITAASDPR